MAVLPLSSVTPASTFDLITHFGKITFHICSLASPQQMLLIYLAPLPRLLVFKTVINKILQQFNQPIALGGAHCTHLKPYFNTSCQKFQPLYCHLNNAEGFLAIA